MNEGVGFLAGNYIVYYDDGWYFRPRGYRGREHFSQRYPTFGSASDGAILHTKYLDPEKTNGEG